MIVKVQEGGFVNLDDFKNLLDISKVVYYKLKVLKNKTLSLKFYDKDKKLIKLYKRYYQLIFFSNDLVYSPMIAKFDSLLELSQELESCMKYKDKSWYIQEVVELYKST